MANQAFVISLSGLHETWREILHLGTHQVLPRSPHHYPATSDCFYFIARGKVRLSYVDENGGDHVVLIFGSGCIFNETDVLAGDDSDVSFRVLETSDVYRFPGKLLHDPNFIRAYPHLVHSMLTGTAVKLSSSIKAMVHMKRGAPVVRLCRFLRQMSLCHNNATAFPLDMTQLELASVLDIHRVSLFRCLKRLRREGVLRKFSHNEIELDSLAALETFMRGQERQE